VSFGSLRFRLLLAAAISILVALGLAAAGLAWLFERHVERWLDSQLEVQLNQLFAGLRASPPGSVMLGKEPPDPRFNEPLSGLYWQVAIEPGGKVLRSRSLWDYQLALPAIAVDDDLRHARLPGPGGSTLYVLQRHVSLLVNLGGGTAQAAVALDAGELRGAVWRFAGALIPFLLLVGALLIAASWVQVSVGLKPLDAMRKALGAIGSGERKRLGTGFPDEVQPLAREIDSLLDGRDAQIEKARTRAADLAHGLKTPLQVLTGDAERLKQSGATQIAGSIESLASLMQRHIHRHLTRARIAPPNEHATANVRAVVERVADVMQRTPLGARLIWWIAVPPDLQVRIDPDDLAEALGSLIENAAQHASSKLTVSAEREHDVAAVTVADDGPGIPRERREATLKRGERLDASGSGTGLGLAIVADIAEACGATLSFDEQAVGLSVTLRVRLAGQRPASKV
jgi:signal transduction histidine kinase